jgi:hypothetical protein
MVELGKETYGKRAKEGRMSKDFLKCLSFVFSVYLIG